MLFVTKTFVVLHSLLCFQSSVWDHFLCSWSIIWIVLDWWWTLSDFVCLREPGFHLHCEGIFLAVVSVSSGCFNKLLQTWLLETIHIYSAMVLEDRSPNSVLVDSDQDVGSALPPLQVPEKHPCLFQHGDPHSLAQASFSKPAVSTASSGLSLCHITFSSVSKPPLPPCWNNTMTTSGPTSRSSTI
jgi:hypothetical protein